MLQCSRRATRAVPRHGCDPHADRCALIGRGLYPAYIRQLRRGLVVVIPLLAAIGLLSDALGDAPTVGSVVVATLRGAGTAVLQVCFWVTTVFALMERISGGEQPQDDAGESSDVFEGPYRCNSLFAMAAPERSRGTQL